MNSVNFNALNNISYSAKPKTVQTEDQKRQSKLGKTIAATAVGAGLTTLVLTQGLSRKGRFNLNKIYNFLTKKSDELSKKHAFTKTEQFTKDAVEMGRSVAESTRSVMNTISLKDILFKKFTNKIPLVNKLCQGTTNFFENVAVKTTKNSYVQTEKQFNKMYSAFEQANEKVSSNTASIGKNTISKVKQVFDRHFSADETMKRISRTKQEFSNLDEKFWEKSFKNPKKLATNKDTFSSFIAEKMMAGKKSKLLSEVNQNKAAIQFSFKDDFNNLKNISEDIKGMINPFDKETMYILDDIKANLDVFNKKQSALAKKAIMEDMKKLTTFIDDKSVAEQLRKSIDSLPASKQGRLQSMLDMYKKELSKDDYKALEKQVKKAMKSLEKSTELETDNLFDKLRDLKIGSAPTDMLTLLTTFATVGIGLGKAENDDERISAALKFGIPAIGTVLTTMYGTLKMFTAAKSLAFGAVTGLLINKIGETADEARKKINTKNVQNTNPAQPTV